MAIIYCDGFDHYDYTTFQAANDWQRWYYPAGLSYGPSYPGRYKTSWDGMTEPPPQDYRDLAWAQFNTGGAVRQYRRRLFPSSAYPLVIGFDVKFWSNPSGSPIWPGGFVRLDDGGAPVIHLHNDQSATDDAIEVWTGGDGTNYDGSFLASGISTIEPETWYYVELLIDSDLVEMRVDGVEEFSIVPSPTLGGISYLSLSWQHFGNRGYAIDNLYVVSGDDTFRNPSRVITLFPYQDTGPNNWLIVDNSFLGGRPDTHSDMLNEWIWTPEGGPDPIPDKSGTYLKGVGGEVSYSVLESPWAYDNPKALNFIWSVQAPSGTGTFQPIFRKNGDTYQPGTVYGHTSSYACPFLPPTNWHPFNVCLDENPFTAAPWTFQDLYGLEVGGICSNSGDIRWTQVAVEALMDQVPSGGAFSIYRGRQLA